MNLSDLTQVLHYVSYDNFIFGEELLNVAEGIDASEIFEQRGMLFYRYWYNDEDFIDITKKDQYGDNFLSNVFSNIEDFDLNKTNLIVYNITSIK